MGRAGVRAAVAVFLLGIFLNAAAGVVSAGLVADYPALTLAWARYASMVVLFLPFAVTDRSLRGSAWRASAPGLVLLGIVSLAALAGFLQALKGVPVATATGLFFCYPFLAVILSVVLLQERATPRDWLRVLLGLSGVLLLLQPFAATPNAFALFALASGVFVAIKTVVTRRLGLALPLMQVAAGEAVVAAVVLAPFAMSGPLWSLVQWPELLLYLALANAARLALIWALSLGRVAALAPLGYLELAFTAGLQVALIGIWPTPHDLAAFAVILAAGVLIRSGNPETPPDKTKRAPEGARH